MATKRIPYGISDFRLLSGEDFYYVDKTRFIGEIEKCPNFLFLSGERPVRGAVRKVLHWQPPDAGTEQLPDFEVQFCDGKPGAGGAGTVL